MDLITVIREVKDFPKQGVGFKDLTTLFKDAESFRYTVNQIVSQFSDKNITKIVGLESRGFIIGGAVAAAMNVGFIPVRKKGKLPGPIFQQTYELEYGTDILEIHQDALVPDDIVLIHDDLLATGGTALAALNLVQQIGVRQIYFSFICDLSFIKTPKKQKLAEYGYHALVEYDK